MVKAIVISSPGGTEALNFKEITLGGPFEGEALIRHTAIGLNYIDIYHRTGFYKNDLPMVPGIEASGVVEAVGTGVEGLKPGDRVCYGTAPHLPFGYATHRTIPAEFLVKIPNDITDEDAATIMVKGMTAHFLLRRTFAVTPDDYILVHAAAGGVGTYLCQWASNLGAIVIGTVGSREKAAWAEENGCHHVINYTTEDWVTRVREITHDKGVVVVYDSVGEATFKKSLECLMPLGLLVSFGQSSGPVPPIDISLLAQGSFFLTRPSIAHYKSERSELVMSALEIFQAVRTGVLKPRITHRIPLKDAAEAHRLLESRSTMGSIVLIP